MKYRYGWVIALMAFAATAPHELLLGAQLLFRSTDEGNHWDAIFA